MNVKYEVRFEPRDLWIGLYWDRDHKIYGNNVVYFLKFWICLIPCFPLVIDISTRLHVKDLAI